MGRIIKQIAYVDDLCVGGLKIESIEHNWMMWTIFTLNNSGDGMDSLL